LPFSDNITVQTYYIFSVEVCFTSLCDAQQLKYFCNSEFDKQRENGYKNLGNQFSNFGLDTGDRIRIVFAYFCRVFSKPQYFCVMVLLIVLLFLWRVTLLYIDNNSLSMYGKNSTGLLMAGLGCKMLETGRQSVVKVVDHFMACYPVLEIHVMLNLNPLHSLDEAIISGDYDHCHYLVYTTGAFCINWAIISCVIYHIVRINGCTL